MKKGFAEQTSDESLWNLKYVELELGDLRAFRTRARAVPLAGICL